MRPPWSFGEAGDAAALAGLAHITVTEKQWSTAITFLE
jgi:hypothetical protein